MRREHAIVLTLLLFALGACANDSGPEDAVPSFTPQGDLLLVTGPQGQDLATYRLPKGPLTMMQVPDGVDIFQQPWFGTDGSAYVYAQLRPNDRRSQLYRVGPGTEPQALGQPLEDSFGYVQNGDVGLSFSGCDRPMRALDLGSGDRWETVGNACGGVPSQEGARIAYLTRDALWTRPISGGSPERLLSFADLDTLKDHHIRVRPYVGSIAWGEGGIAFLMGTEAAQALVVRSSSGKVTVVPLDRQVLQLQWQPNGTLLGIADGTSRESFRGTGEIRILDPAAGRLRQVAITSGFAQFQWSPDGRVLAVAKGANTTAFLDTRGNLLSQVRVEGFLSGWR